MVRFIMGLRRGDARKQAAGASRSTGLSPALLIKTWIIKRFGVVNKTVIFHCRVKASP